MLLLIFDTETTGLFPKNKVLSLETVHEWPYIVQFSFVTFNTETNKLIEYDYIIKTSHIPEESTKIHGITESMNKAQGFEFKSIYNIFKICLDQCDLIIGHNIQFDIQMLQAECLRNSIPFVVNKQHVCTMKSTTKMCNLPRMKWPTLNELHQHLFKESVHNLHNSIVDVIICLRCYYYINYHTDLFEIIKKYKKISRVAIELNKVVQN
jgi:DNA polymerase III epsilon subunit-like protein